MTKDIYIIIIAFIILLCGLFLYYIFHQRYFKSANDINDRIKKASDVGALRKIATDYLVAHGWTAAGSPHLMMLDDNVLYKNSNTRIILQCVNPTWPTNNPEFPLERMLILLKEQVGKAYSFPLVFLYKSGFSPYLVRRILDRGIVIIHYSSIPELSDLALRGTPDLAPDGTWQRTFLVQVATRCLEISKLYRKDVDFNNAIQWGNYFLKSSPRDISSYRHLVQLYIDNNDMENADRLCQVGLDLNQNDRVMLILASVINNKINNKDRCIYYGKRLVLGWPTQDSHRIFVDFLIKFQEFGQARQALQAGLSAYPDDKILQSLQKRIPQDNV